MTIRRKPGKRDEAAEAFVEQAPDAGHTQREPGRRGRRKQISLTVPDPVLEAVDAYAEHHGISRAATFIMAARKLVDRESS